MEEKQAEDSLSKEITPISGLYDQWFLDYASYVILDRAVPHINDGFKPVQRRIMHSLKEMDDGRFNKVANVIGNTMKYHPHGDASIGAAMVQIGQKDLLIDCQGNWGDPVTGDAAAAPRYIEGRLSKFANEIIFNADTTEWQLSYDGRNKEPITFPVKFPLLLAQGAEGIAVGLATKIMPHNFNELIDGAIQVLKGERPMLMPDFPTGAYADCSNYNEGMRGGRIKVRAKIEEIDKKTLKISEIPYGTTTGGIIESVISANEKGKIKIKRIEDNTARDVEILIYLAPGISPDVTIDALYAFTDCEVSISPNTCVIKDNKPHFLSVNDVLIENTKQTRSLLKQELEIRLNELMEKIFFSTLLKIFIVEGMYKHPEYEQSGSFDEVVLVLNKLFEPFFAQFYREILPEDYKKLIDKPMSSITRFDVKRADEQMQALEDEIKQVKKNLKSLTAFTIAWFEHLKGKYGKDKPRKTELRTFDKVEAAQVALANIKLYVNRSDGFVGTGLRKDEYVGDCSDLDEIIVFRADGKFLVSKVQEKVFVGKNILHVAVFRKGDDRTVYNVIYRDSKSGVSYVKRFSVLGVTRGKEYDLTKGEGKVIYFTANDNGEAEVVHVQLKPHSKLRKLQFDLDFADIAIKGRGAKGNIVTKYPIRKVSLKSKGVSTLEGRKLWFDPVLNRLNVDERGNYLGEFDGEDLIVTINKEGAYTLSTYELTNHYDNDLVRIEKFDPEKIYTIIHKDGKNKQVYVKRFKIEVAALGKKNSLINESPGSSMLLITDLPKPLVTISLEKGKSKLKEDLQQDLSELIDVKGMKAQGNRLSPHTVLRVALDGNNGDPVPVSQNADEEGSSSKESKKQDKEKALPQDKEKSEKKSDSVQFEITNPDDVEMDGNGQMGLF